MKIYLCIPLGGQGAHHACSHRPFCPSIHTSKLSCEIVTAPWSSTGMLASSKWSRTPPDASGSSTIRAKLLTSVEIFSTVSCGKYPSPSQVYLEGSGPLSTKSVEIFIGVFLVVKSDWVDSQIFFLFSGENTLIQTRTTMQTIINASRKRFFILNNQTMKHR